MPPAEAPMTTMSRALIHCGLPPGSGEQRVIAQRPPAAAERTRIEAVVGHSSSSEGPAAGRPTPQEASTAKLTYSCQLSMAIEGGGARADPLDALVRPCSPFACAGPPPTT